MYDQIKVRVANIADGKSITSLYLTSRNKYLSFAPLVHSNSVVLNWIHQQLIPTNQLYVAEHDHNIVGMMAITKRENIGWIDDPVPRRLLK